jgi:putative hemolysin
VNFFEILVCLLLIGLASFVSAAEVALFSLSRFQLKALKERFRSAHRKVRRLLADPSGLLLTLIVFSEVINIALSTLIAEAVNESWDASGGDLGSAARWPWLLRRLLPGAPDWALQTLAGTLITWPIVLLFCEITPKVIAARASQLIAALSAGPLTVAYDAFRPFRAALTAVVNGFARLLSSGTKKTGGSRASASEGEEQILKEEDFLSIVEQGHREGDIQQSEMSLIRKVFELDNTPVSEVMLPFDQVLSLPASTPVRAALGALPTRRFSRIPIHGLNRKRIEGVLYSKDLLIARLENDPETLSATVATLMRRPMTVAASTRLNNVFLRMKKQKMHMAIVENPLGEAVGVVTMNDVLETLFEDLMPDEEELA